MSFARVLPWLLPQAREARGSAQFEGLGLLLLRDLNGFEKTFFGFALGIGGQGSGIGNFDF